VATALGRTEGGGGWGIRKWEAKAKGAADSGDSGRQWRGGERRRQERQAARMMTTGAAGRTFGTWVRAPIYEKFKKMQFKSFKKM
jgi:hypothetical protein